MVIRNHGERLWKIFNNGETFPWNIVIEPSKMVISQLQIVIKINGDLTLDTGI